MEKIKLGDIAIGKNQPCFIIAEAGVNHNGSLFLAKKLVDQAKKAGADTVKFQTFKSEDIVASSVKQAEYQSKNTGKKETQYEMLKSLELSYKDFQELKNYCQKKRIIFSSTPHSSKEDIDFVAKNCSFIKVGSGDLTNLPMLKYVALKNLPIILSTGMANMQEIREAVKTILPVNKKLILLHCTTNYPTPFAEVNLRAITTLRKEFNLPVGYSDHTMGTEISLAAVAIGACVIEKHFTIDKNLAGPDHKASLNPLELKTMVEGIRNVENGLGNGIKKPYSSELKIAKVVRKSIVAARPIKKGETIEEGMLAIKRPGTGILPKYLGKIVGKKSKFFIKKDQLIQWRTTINK